jgi:curved DNA-binding protein
LGNAGVFGGARGDLHIQIHQTEDTKYTRKGDDLYIKYDVSALDLILGKTFDVETPTGNITVTIPPGTQPTAKIRVKDKGINGGNFYIAFNVIIPTQLTSDEMELYTKLRNLEFSI